jgi:hypothetical protein
MRDRYKVEMSELTIAKARSWLKKTLKENEKLSLISHTQCNVDGGKIRNTLIFEDPLLGLMSHLETQDSLLGDDEDDE